MGKLKVGDRVRIKPTVIGTIKEINENWLFNVLIVSDDGDNYFRQSDDLKKLKPKKPRRECWVEYLKGVLVYVYHEKPIGEKLGYEMVHMKEIRK